MGGQCAAMEAVIASDTYREKQRTTEEKMVIITSNTSL